MCHATDKGDFYQLNLIFMQIFALQTLPCLISQNIMQAVYNENF